MAYGAMLPYLGQTTAMMNSQMNQARLQIQLMSSAYRPPCNGGNFGYNPYDSFRPNQQFGWNMPNSQVGPQWRNGCGCMMQGRGQGYALDLNGNGRYDRGRDGVLVFDMNRNGRYDQSDVKSTNDMMKAARGDFDFNGDGKVSLAERMRGRALQQQFRKLDKNGDGQLSAHEIAAGGGKVWVDHNRNGHIGKNELHSPFNIPSSYIGGPSQRLNSVNPFTNTNSTSSNLPWWPSGYWGMPPMHNGGAFNFGFGFGYN